MDSMPHYTNPTASEYLRQVDQAVDWSREAVREAREENVIVSADFQTITLLNTLFVRTTQPQATLHLGAYWEENSSIYGPYNIDGAQASQEFYVDNSSMFLRLNLPNESATIHRVSYTYRITCPQPCTEYTLTSLLSWPLRLYTCTLTFEGEVPPRITWTLTSESDNEGKKKNIIPRTLTPVGKTVTVTRNNVPSGESVLSWS